MGKRICPMMLGLGLAWTGSAGAGLIDYSVQATLSGTLNGVAFTNALVRITAAGNPDATLYDPTNSEYHTLATATTLTVAGFNSVSFTDKIEVVDAQGPSPGVFRIYDVTVNKSILGVSDDYFTTYDLHSPFGPITDRQTHDFGNSYGTTGGELILTGNAVGNLATGAATSVPEPSSIFMTGLPGIFALGLLGRKGVRHLFSSR